jgi:hypothetical protein
MGQAIAVGGVSHHSGPEILFWSAEEGKITFTSTEVLAILIVFAAALRLLFDREQHRGFDP